MENREIRLMIIQHINATYGPNPTEWVLKQAEKISAFVETGKAEEGEDKDFAWMETK